MSDFKDPEYDEQDRLGQLALAISRLSYSEMMQVSEDLANMTTSGCAAWEECGVEPTDIASGLSAWAEEVHEARMLG